MTAARGAMIAAVVIAAGGCFTSPPATSDPAAVDPHGMRGRVVMTNGRKVDAELLMIDDTAYVLETSGRIAIARHSDVRSAEFPRVGVLTVRARHAPPARAIRAARARARFPYGISEGTMAALLARSQQDAPDDLGAGAAASAP